MNGFRVDVMDWIGWGTFTYSTSISFSLLQAYFFDRRAEYLEGAFLNLDTQLGAHPLGMSFITGLGVTTPRRPTCEVAAALMMHRGSPCPAERVLGTHMR